MMRIDRNLAPQPRETYARAAAAEQSNTSKSNPTTGADTVTISEEGRQASIAAQMEAAGIDPALAEKLGLEVTCGSDFHGDDIKRKKRS